MADQIRWSPRAISQLEEICQYIAKDSDHYAAFFAKQIMGVVKAIPQFPKAGRVVPEYGNPDLREKICNNYRIVYRLKDAVIEIVAITHGAKPLGEE